MPGVERYLKAQELPRAPTAPREPGGTGEVRAGARGQATPASAAVALRVTEPAEVRDGWFPATVDGWE